MMTLFVPMIVILCGLSWVLANASTLALSQVKDKAHGSAMMNFLNMGLATIVVSLIGSFAPYLMLLPIIYLAICAFMVPEYWFLTKRLV
jgi:hypothetical protein